MLRAIREIRQAVPAMEGAGVRLRRVFGFGEPTRFDPFLLLDDFRGDRPEDYLAGFPWHPHRGIETITYVLAGQVQHGDSLGNEGTIGAGDVQWMTAGRGIVHQEMPTGDPDGRMGGFQLWANLPRSHKMMEPRYRNLLAAQLAEVSRSGGVRVKVIAGEFDGQRGPVRDVMIEPVYFDVSMPVGSEITLPARRGHTAFAYLIEGAAAFDGQGQQEVSHRHLVAFADGDEIAVATPREPARFLYVTGKPLGEPVAWRGPIVMNTEAELRKAFEEYRTGTFIKRGKGP